jgi:hypothetical protein
MAFSSGASARRRRILGLTLFIAASTFPFPIGAVAADSPEQELLDSQADNEAMIYILRPSSFVPTARMWTFADERLIGATRGGSYTVAPVAEGRHLFWSKSENIATLEIEAEAGATYFIKQIVLEGERNPRVKLVLLSAARGRMIRETCEYRPLREKDRARGERIGAKHLAGARSIGAEERRVTRVVERARKSVLRVETENGYATGFLIDSAGFILASVGLHAAHFEASEFMGALPPFGYSPSNRIAVVLTPGRRAEAQLIEYNSSRFAVLRIHPSLVEGVEPLVPASRSPAKGDQLLVVCPGSDGNATWARASVWKAQRRASPVFYVDVKIDRRDLGCPFLDLDGGVAGTYWGQAFGDSHKPEVEQARMVLAFHRLESTLARVRSKVAKQKLPPAELLPEAPEAEYPHDMARSVAATIDAANYITRMELVDLEFLTPPLLHKLEATDSSTPHDRQMQIVRYTPSEGFFRWREYAGTAQAVVVIQAVPKIKKVINRSTDYASMIGFVLNPADRAFEPDFQRLDLLRDGIPVEPVRPGRICGRFKVHARSAEGVVEWRDKLYGCYGSYAYRPEEFAPEATVAVSVSTSGGTVKYVLPRETLERIQADFRPFFAMQEEAETTAPRE